MLYTKENKGGKRSYLDDTCKFGAKTMLPVKHNAYSFKNMLSVSMNWLPDSGPVHVISIWKNHVSEKKKPES
jgi:hypothetical protein